MIPFACDAPNLFGHAAFYEGEHFFDSGFDCYPCADVCVRTALLPLMPYNKKPDSHCFESRTGLHC